MDSPHRPGTLTNVTVYAPEDGYAAFPCLMRTAHDLILEFMHQPLEPLRASGVHPHYAAVSQDGGRTWDLSTLRTLHTFDPGSYDIGYPVALQRDDGAICCAYYGCSTPDIGSYSPHGVFVSLFDEAWMEEEGHRSESR